MNVPIKAVLIQNDDCVGDDYYIVTKGDGTREEITVDGLTEDLKKSLDSLCLSKK